MKNILLFLALAFLVSCGNERELQLPQIEKANITKIQDVSAAYLFYDETQPDSVLLNRKNLISTTNWLVNVDKRLTLKQAIPHIKFLQDKKKSSSHKNENAKNYFTCHDLGINNLGFLEFTKTNFNVEKLETLYSDFPDVEYTGNVHSVNIGLNNDISILLGYSINIIIKTNKTDLREHIEKLDTLNGKVFLNFHKDLRFQEYIDYKSELTNINLNHLSISNHEFIYN